MTHIQELFINNIRFYRTQRDYSQSKFAELIDVSPNYYNAVENGKYFPSIDVLDSICVILDILPFQLFLEAPNSAPTNNEYNSQKLVKLREELYSTINKYIY